MIKVSIVIPIYNVEEYIERCLFSVLHQTYQEVEIILVDDCSPDHSMEIAMELVKNSPERDKVIFIKHKSNKGLSAARNTGINISTGEYIYFLDSDDEITPNAIELFVGSVVANNKPDFVIGGFKAIDDIYGTINPLTLSEQYIADNKSIQTLFVQRKWYVMAWNKLIKSSFLKKENLFFKEGIIHEDVLWSFLLANKARTMAVMDKEVYNYYVRANSIATSVSPKRLTSIADIIKEINIFLNDGTVDVNRENVSYLFSLQKTLTIDVIISSLEISNENKRDYIQLAEFSSKYRKYSSARTLGDIIIRISHLFPIKFRIHFLNLYFCKFKPLFRK